MARKREYKGVTQAQRDANARYDAENTVRMTVKLNRKTDADILARLEMEPKKQTYIKAAIRKVMDMERKVGMPMDVTEPERSEFRYGMKHRGFSPGCQPKGTVRREDDPTERYYDIIVYDRQLTEREIRDFELDDLN